MLGQPDRIVGGLVHDLDALQCALVDVGIETLRSGQLKNCNIPNFIRVPLGTITRRSSKDMELRARRIELDLTNLEPKGYIFFAWQPKTNPQSRR